MKRAELPHEEDDRRPPATPGPPPEDESNTRRPEPAKPTATPKEQRPPTGSEIINYGLDPSKIGLEGDRFRAESVAATRFVERLKRAAADDATKMHLTIIGTESHRRRVLTDLTSHPSLVPFRDRLMVQDYEPGEWEVDPSLGFQSGSPAIIIQTGKTPSDPKGGKVLWRTNDYHEGPSGLAEALRRANPDYRPDLDPGPGSTNPFPLAFSVDSLPYLLGGAIVLFVVFKLPAKQQRKAGHS